MCNIIEIGRGVRNYGPDTIWIDGQTEGRTDGVIPIYMYPLNFVCEGYTYCWQKWYLKQNFLNHGSKLPSHQKTDLNPLILRPFFFNLIEDDRRKQYPVWYDSMTLPLYLRFIPYLFYSNPAQPNHSLSYEPTDPSSTDQPRLIPDEHTYYTFNGRPIPDQYASPYDFSFVQICQRSPRAVFFWHILSMKAITC